MVVDWVHLKSKEALQMHPDRTAMHLGAFGEHLCSPNVPSALP